MNFFEILKLIKAALAIGAPPDIDDESAFRKWVCNVLSFLVDLAKLTANDMDDALIAKVHALEENDQYWSLMYAILKAAAGFLGDDQDKIIVDDANVTALADEVAIDPGTIIMIIQLVIGIIDWWKKRR